MVYNHSIKNIKALVRLSHLTKREEDKHTFHNIYLFAIQSWPNKILTFHGMTDYGMLRSRIPIDVLYLKEPANDIPGHYKQLWDCFSENVTVTIYEYLQEKKGQILLRDGQKIWAKYLFTVDWYNNSYSDARWRGVGWYRDRSLQRRCCSSCWRWCVNKS